VYLSGVEEKKVEAPTDTGKKFKRDAQPGPAVTEPTDNIEFTVRDLENLMSTCEKRNDGDCIDILLTNQWPKYVDRLNNQPLVWKHFIFKHNINTVIKTAFVDV
jgi:hypothetical protein